MGHNAAHRCHRHAAPVSKCACVLRGALKALRTKDRLSFPGNETAFLGTLLPHFKKEDSTHMQTPQPTLAQDRLIRLPEVESVTGTKKSTIYKLVRDGSFPQPVRLSARMVAWSEVAVQAWIRARIQGVGAP